MANPSNPSDGTAVRLFILTARRLYGWAIAQAVEGHGALRVIGVAHEAGAALSALRQLEPDVVLVDLEISESAVVLQALADAAPGVKLVAVAPFADAHDLLTCARARVAGYVSGDDSPEELVMTIEGVARGEMRCSPLTASPLIDEVAVLATERTPGALDGGLTRREREVLELVDSGLSNKEIARELSIELPTVKNHVHRILRKLNVNRRTEAMARPGSRRGPIGR